MKIFNLEPFDGPVTDDESLDIKIVDFDAVGGDCCDTCDVRVYIPGTPGPEGPEGPPGPTGPTGASRPIKTGLIDGGDFTGTPKTFAVVFVAPYDDTDYSIAISGTDSRSYTYESKTAAGFTVNANAGAVIAGEVSWTTMTLGET